MHSKYDLNNNQNIIAKIKTLNNKIHRYCVIISER